VVAALTKELEGIKTDNMDWKANYEETQRRHEEELLKVQLKLELNEHIINVRLEKLTQTQSELADMLAELKEKGLTMSEAYEAKLLEAKQQVPCAAPRAAPHCPALPSTVPSTARPMSVCASSHTIVQEQRLAQVQKRVARAKKANGNFKASLALPSLPLPCTSRCASLLTPPTPRPSRQNRRRSSGEGLQIHPDNKENDAAAGNGVGEAAASCTADDM